MLSRVHLLVGGWIVAGMCLFVAGWQAGGISAEERVWPFVQPQAVQSSIEISGKAWGVTVSPPGDIPVSFKMRNLTSAPVPVLRESYPAGFVIIRDEHGVVVYEPSGMHCGSWDPLDLSDFIILGPGHDLYLPNGSAGAFLGPGKYTAEFVYQVSDPGSAFFNRGAPLSDLERQLLAATPRGRVVSNRVPFTLTGRLDQVPH